MKKLSVVVSTFNEEAKIRECLESVSFVDEIIVVDHESKDKTIEIAKKFTKHIYSQKNDPLQIDIQKNYGFTKATGEWVLSLDADERVTKELQEEIKNILLNNDQSINGYWIPRKNIIFGKWIQHGLWWPDYQLRLFRKGKGNYTGERVHEYITVKGETEKVKNPMLHLNYETVSQYLTKMITIYSTSEANALVSSQKNVIWVDAIRFPANDFLKTFFLQKGYKDGLHGLALSILQAFYMEIVFLKVWEHQGFKEETSPDFLNDVSQETKKIAKEFKYWIFTSAIDENSSFVKKSFYRILRKSTK